MADKHSKAGGLEALAGCDVEVRCGGGQVHRGQLIEASAEWLVLDGAHTRRRVFVRMAAVSAVVDETAAPPQPAGRTHRRGAEGE